MKAIPANRLLRSSRIAVFLVPVSLILLGFVWSIASPQGSSADEDFHTINIYCANGESPDCRFDEASGQVFVPESFIQSWCYVSWPAYQGAGCLDDNSSDLVATSRYAGNQNAFAPLYFRTMNVFAGSDHELSILVMRLVNVAIAAGLLLWAMLASTPGIRRALALSWGVALVPVGIFFIASVNPSAWLIASTGTYWAFLASILANKARNRVESLFLWTGLLASTIIALGARIDAFIYLAMITLSVFIWRGRRVIFGLGVKIIIPLIVVLLTGLVMGVRFFLNRYTNFSFSFPGAQTSTDQPNAIIKNLVELPAFLLGLLGGQGPQVGLATGAANEAQDGHTYSGFYYGIGWMDFSLPPLVSIIAGMGLAGVIFVAMRQYSASKFLSLIFIVIAVVVLILFMRATIAFAWGSQIQPRYIFPVFLAGVGLALAVGVRHRPLLSKLQAGVLVVGITTAASIAWLATATRYAVGPNAAYTNFGQTPEWWWNIGPGRLGWFLISVVVSGLWTYSTIWVWGRVSKESFQPKVRGEVNV